MKKLFLALIAVFSTVLSSFAANGALGDLQRYTGAGSPQTLEPPEVSAPAALETQDRTRTAQSAVSLSDFRGKTFLQFMTAPDGMKAALDKAQLESFTFADKGSILRAADSFDSDVYKKILRSLTGGQAGLDKLMDALAGQTATPGSAAGMIAGELKELNLAAQPEKLGLTAVAAAPFLALASGSGVTTILDQHNYDSPVKSLFCTKIVFVAAGFSLRSRREMVSCLSQAKACGYHLGLFTGESTIISATVINPGTTPRNLRRT